MGSRWLLSIMTVLAMLFGSVHSLAMAAEMPAVPVVSQEISQKASAPCHMAAAEKPTLSDQKNTAQKNPPLPDCCPGNCDGTCTPTAALPALPGEETAGFKRAAVAPVAMAAAPSGSRTADERPPKISV